MSDRRSVMAYIMKLCNLVRGRVTQKGNFDG
jgi:hypothetical protein